MAQNRRIFLQTGALSLTALSTIAFSKPTHAAETDIMGRSKLMASRLGFGAGDGKDGHFQKMGQDKFTQLIRYAYDQGVRYFDMDAGPINAMLVLISTQKVRL